MEPPTFDDIDYSPDDETKDTPKEADCCQLGDHLERNEVLRADQMARKTTTPIKIDV